MTGELVVLAVAIAGAGLFYLHRSGKRFDQKFVQASGDEAPKERHSTGQ